MELFTIDTILPIASGALFITQAVYYLGLYNKLYTHSRETAYATDINTQKSSTVCHYCGKRRHPRITRKPPIYFRAKLSGNSK